MTGSYLQDRISYIWLFIWILLLVGYDVKPSYPLTPIVTSIIPSTGHTGFTQNVKIKGSNFEKGAKVSLLNGGPFLASSYDTSGYAYGIYVSGKYAYVADGGAGLQIVDISNPNAPALAGAYNTPHWAEDVYVSGKYAYVADGGAGLQ
ncbi:MAG: hypothetical protein ACE5EA_05075, partial [Nitrospirota bacterium]